MPTAPFAPVLHHVRALAGGGLDSLSDQQLVDRFTRLDDGAAFAGLVRRHGPMVYNRNHNPVKSGSPENEKTPDFSGVLVALWGRLRHALRCRKVVRTSVTTAQRAKTTLAKSPTDIGTFLRASPGRPIVSRIF